MVDVYKLVRVLDGGRELQITASFVSQNLIEYGEILTPQHPDWTLEVKDPQNNVIWSNKKNALGKAEDTPQNGN